MILVIPFFVLKLCQIPYIQLFTPLPALLFADFMGCFVRWSGRVSILKFGCFTKKDIKIDTFGRDSSEFFDTENDTG